MPRFSIKNRIGLEIVGDILIPEKSVGLAFVLHGLGGFRAQKSNQIAAQTIFSNNYTVVVFDATNSNGESGGRYEDATVQKHYEDLVDVITWAKKQNWYQEPFVLFGSSMGGYAVIKYAQEYPQEVKAIFSFASLISGKLSLEAMEKFRPDELKNWEESGWLKRASISKPGVMFNLPWSHMEERLNHDLILKVDKLIMPISILVGEKDESCPVEQQKILYDLLSGKKEFNIVPGAPHVFREAEHLNQLKSILDKWVREL